MEPTQCPKCGMSRDQWSANAGAGYDKGGERYCCRGCAENTGCTWSG